MFLMSDIKAAGKASESFQDQAVTKLRVIFCGKILLADKTVKFQVLMVFCLLPFSIHIKIIDQEF